MVETSLRVLGKTAECYKSGAPDEIGIIVGNLHTIEGLNDELKGFLPDPLGKTSFSSAELRLVEANEQCLRLSGDFIQLLDSLKVTKKSVWRSIGISIKSMWYQDKLASFEKEISESRANLTLAFLLLMHERSLTMHSHAIRTATDVEYRMLDILKKNTGSLEAGIIELTSRLKEMSFDQSKDRMGEFSSEHQIQLAQISEQLAQIWEHQRASDQASKSLEASKQGVAPQHRLLQSLQFPQMQDRREEISRAYENTYEWLFQDHPGEEEGWHSFVAWARRLGSPQRIYWIHGKPGSGKSTLSRFVYDRLDIDDHLRPWAESRAVVKAAHFFWNPGTTLQKSWIGMLRSLFSQLLDQVPGLSEPCVSPSRWRAALSSEAISTEWTSSELLHGIHSFVRKTEAYLFFLIDGLDELQGDEERREELISFVFDLGSYTNVKLCISSRPDNIFRDAFQDCPRLKLESLTYSDIRKYVEQRFAKERSIRNLSPDSLYMMKGLITFLVDAASGVFLWVRLVVHDLIRAARDGATSAELVEMAHQVPRDLDSYFTRFIDSIPPEYRREASYLFQITLFDEESFTSMHGLRLLDLSYIGKIQGSADTHGGYYDTTFDPNNIPELGFRLDTTARRVNSRCRGLIECYEGDGDKNAYVWCPDISEMSEIDYDAQCPSPSHTRSMGLLDACNRHVGLIHRSLRDFLMSPKILEQLQASSDGPFNTRLFLCKARLAQIQSLDYEGNNVHAQLAMGLSSYVLSALSTDDLKHCDESALIATQLRPIVESLARSGAHVWSNKGWYLSSSFNGCEAEIPDFLGVAIDFDLVAYLKNELTTRAIQAKRGLSVLNCILIGRFSDYLGSETMIGNRFPNIEVLRLALQLGADPNESPDGISVWAEFLGHLDTLADRAAPPAYAQKAHVEAIRALLEYGAHPELPKSWFTPGPLIPILESDPMPVSNILECMMDVRLLLRIELCKQAFGESDTPLMAEELDSVVPLPRVPEQTNENTSISTDSGDNDGSSGSTEDRELQRAQILAHARSAPTPPATPSTLGIIDEIDVDLSSTDISEHAPGLYVARAWIRPRNFTPQEIEQIFRRLEIDLTHALSKIRAKSCNKPRNEGMVMIDMRMAGTPARGSTKVTLRPCIWIFCGSKWCQKIVERDVKALNWLESHNVRCVRKGGPLLATDPESSAGDLDQPLGSHRSPAERLRDDQGWYHTGLVPENFAGEFSVGNSSEYPEISPYITAPGSAASTQLPLEAPGYHWQSQLEPFGGHSYGGYTGFDASSVTSSMSSYSRGRQSSGSSLSQPHGTAAISTDAPSRVAHYTDVNSTINRQAAPTQVYELPCELRNITGCNVVFAGDDERAWMDHIESHLGGSFPVKFRCWFCNDHYFDARQTSNGDLRYTFTSRMQHIRHHIVHEGYRHEQMLRDGHVIQHLFDRNLIDSRTYNGIWETVTVQNRQGHRSHHSIHRGSHLRKKLPQVEEDVDANRKNSHVSNHRSSIHSNDHESVRPSKGKNRFRSDYEESFPSLSMSDNNHHAPQSDYYNPDAAHSVRASFTSMSDNNHHAPRSDYYNPDAAHSVWASFTSMSDNNHHAPRSDYYNPDTAHYVWAGGTSYNGDRIRPEARKERHYGSEIELPVLTELRLHVLSYGLTSLIGLRCIANAWRDQIELSRSTSRVGGAVLLTIDGRTSVYGVTAGHGLVHQYLNSSPQTVDDLYGDGVSDDSGSESEDETDSQSLSAGSTYAKARSSIDSSVDLSDVGWTTIDHGVSAAFGGARFLRTPQTVSQPGKLDVEDTLSGDLALFPLDSLHRPGLTNNYIQPSNLEAKEVTSISENDCEIPLPVFVLLDPEQVLSGTIQPGKFHFSMGGVPIDARQLRLSRDLAPGSSGSWVVHDQTLYGMIVAIFPGECTALMVPSKRMLSDVKMLCPGVTDISVAIKH
ncbi:hypothetical protein KVR01_004081 [Diaporthe batatas]|uniref:uncharacterized protein n=1 Tax=Diaporthe batatas TaxID=748121 RepID=UPI001D055968|nr:uncharacterized protein KVR01_004081 [Diaporthe batatas]KAG8165529.1 hypothetical protein KVR01_004081 [Diaporthe batatas]